MSYRAELNLQTDEVMTGLISGQGKGGSQGLYNSIMGGFGAVFVAVCHGRKNVSILKFPGTETFSCYWAFQRCE